MNEKNILEKFSEYLCEKGIKTNQLEYLNNIPKENGLFDTVTLEELDIFSHCIVFLGKPDQWDEAHGGVLCPICNATEHEEDGNQVDRLTYSVPGTYV